MGKLARRTIALALAAIAAVALLAGCSAGGREPSQKVSGEEAYLMMNDETGYAIVDVRTAEEFAAGHIPGAVNVPVESIGEVQPAELPDTGQRLFVYCRTGKRSADASEKLVALGYTDIVDIGGLDTWPGDVTAEE